MYELINWYNSEEKTNNLTPIELAALFHYRYIRIHPFEDGNGRIARLLVNFILLRHNYPMVVVLSRKKRQYLNALGMADANVGPIPSDGANASIKQISSFVKYMTNLMIAEITQNIAYIKASPQSTWWYDGDVISFRSKNTVMLLDYLKNHPKATISELSTILSINPSAVQKQLKSLSEKGYITKTHSNNEWRVIAISTTK